MIITVKNTFIQFFLIFGVVGIAGFALTLLSRWTNNVFRQFAWPELGTYLFGWIGVPVHEFCHAFFCAVFLHRIQKVKWFDPKGKGGAQGSVTHSYHPWNLYHRVGHFFIGLGPIILAPLLLAAVAHFLVPATPYWSRANLSSPGFWVFVYLAMCVSSQIELSREDLNQAATGLLPVILVLFLGILTGWCFDFSGHAIVIGVAVTIVKSSSEIYTLAVGLSAVNLVACTLLLGLANRVTGREFVNPFRT